MGILTFTKKGRIENLSKCILVYIRHFGLSPTGLRCFDATPMEEFKLNKKTVNKQLNTKM